MPKLLYQGHASLRLVSDRGVVLYIDPFAGGGYTLPADIVLITHAHEDHNRPDLVKMAQGGRVITHQDAQVNGVYNRFRIRQITVRGLPAFNDHHDPRDTVGYLIYMDGLRIYVAGDTSQTDAMEELQALKLDYAFLPVDGVCNMDPVMASICAALIGAKYSIPYHMKPGALFDMKKARLFDIPGRLILQPGMEIDMRAP